MTTLQTPSPETSGPDSSGPTASNADLPTMQRKLSDRLERLGGRVRARIAFDALARALAALLGMLALSLVLDFWLELSQPVRVLYWVATVAVAAHFLYHYGLKPLGRKLGPVELAEAVDVAKGHRGTQQLAPRVATVLQLPAMFGSADQALSDQMIEDAVGRSYRSLEQTDFNAALDNKHTMQCVGILLAAMFIPGIVGGVMSAVGDNVVGTWAQRWLMLADTPYPRNTAITIQGLNDQGQLIVPAGENFTIRALIENKDKTEASEARLDLRPEEGKDRTEALAKFDPTDFRLDMSPLTEPASATLRAGDQTLAFDIVPAARPRLTGLKLSTTHPSDEPGTPPRAIDFNGAEGEVSLLELHEVELVFTANVPIEEARYVIDETRDQDKPLPPIERVGDKSFALRWTHNASQRLRIELVSRGAGLVSQPIPLSVGLKKDNKPKVRARSTGVGQRITPNALIPLSEIKATDDIGLRDLALSAERQRATGDDAGLKEYDPIVLYEDPEATKREVFDKHDLEVDQFGVIPGDVLRLTGVATDDRYTGRQTGASTTLNFRIVTHKELFREIIARQQQARAAFRQAIEDSKDVHAALVQAKSGVEAAAQERRFRKIRRDVWKVSNELAKSAEEMRLNRLGGTKEDGNQAYESMKSTILNPLERLHSVSMERQLGALQSANNADEVRRAELASDQLALVQEMTELLAKMDRWDELLDAINQLSEVINQQELLKEKLDELVDEQLDDLFDE